MRKFGVPVSSRFTFTLNVDTNVLDAQIGCIPIVKTFGSVPVNSTRIDDFMPVGSTFSFLDPSKKTKRWMVTMKDLITKELLPNSTDIPCYWCHKEFTTSPLGCPIQLIRNTPVSTYYSHASKKEVEVKGEVIREEYLTEGIFGGWGCLIGYANSVRHRIVNRESIQFIGQMYAKCGGKGLPIATPPFSARKKYGGPLSDEEYDAHQDTYKKTDNYYIRMIPVGDQYEVTSKF